MKKWRCTVCGHIHTGDQPPAKCPVCGAAREKFVLIDESTPVSARRTSSRSADVIVVGSGAAAFSAAITARRLGATVIMLEKADNVGGTTARSGGGFWVPGNYHQRAAGIADPKDQCLKYMARYSFPHLYNPDAALLGLPEHNYAQLESYYDHAHEIVEYLELAGALKTIMEINWTGAPQVDYMDHLPENGGVRGRSIYPMDGEGKLGYGNELIAQFERWAASNGIEIATRCEVTDIIMEDGRAAGVRAIHDGEEVSYSANRGVIFGSGGFSHDPELMLSFQRGPHYGGCSVPTNTGDFIRLAGTIGAQIGNTAGAFRADSMIESALNEPGGSSNIFYIGGDSVIIVNKYGNRIVDEKRNYNDRAMVHFVWDAQAAEWTNMITFMIFDSRTASLWQGFPPYPVAGQNSPYIIAADTLDGLAARIGDRLDGVSGHTGGFTLDESFLAGLRRTIARYNDFATRGVDEDFHRGDYAYDREWTTFPPTLPGAAWPEEGAVNYTMHPISGEGPYYAVLLAAGTLDTNGGPVVDAGARVIDWAGRPIPGLYGAGNCIASPTANAYWGAGSTIGPALTFGYLAAKNCIAD